MKDATTATSSPTFVGREGEVGALHAQVRGQRDAPERPEGPSLHRAVGEHLRTAIRTGAYCAYLPDPRMQISWT